LRPDLQVIAELITPGSSVLDLGCGDGALLEFLKETRGVRGRGIELSEEGVLACVRRGLSVRQGNLQEGLADYPDQRFDYVILSQTIQYLDDPGTILSEMLRVGRLAIVSFPNWGCWRSRLELLIRGRVPPAPDVAQPWYEAPRRQALTAADFVDYCRLHHIDIHQSRHLSGRRLVHLLPNLTARTAVYALRRR
jgi:methionine biosynthesis protein MetW